MGRTSWTAIPTASHVLDLPFILLNLSGRFFCKYKQGPNFHIHSSEPSPCNLGLIFLVYFVKKFLDGLRLLIRVHIEF